MRQVVLAVALESGRSVKDASEVLGVTPRRTYDILGEEDASITELRSLIKPLTRATVGEIKAIAVEDFREALGQHLGEIVDAVRRSVSDRDAHKAAATAIATLPFIVGKPKSTLEVTGGTKNETTYRFAPEVMKALTGGIVGSQRLHEAARQIEGVIDVAAD